MTKDELIQTFNEVFTSGNDFTICNLGHESGTNYGCTVEVDSNQIVVEYNTSPKTRPDIIGCILEMKGDELLNFFYLYPEDESKIDLSYRDLKAITLLQGSNNET